MMVKKSINISEKKKRKKVYEKKKKFVFYPTYLYW